jgi:hypothetical protein
MKKIGLLGICFATMYANAQNVKLEAGRKITITTTATNISAKPEQMGGGEVKTENVTTTILNVTSLADKKYIASSSVVRVTNKGENMMGEIDFDSDRKDDRTTDMGKSLSSEVDKKIDIEISNEDGKITKVVGTKTEEEKEQGGGGIKLMSGDKNTADIITGSAFFVIPTDKKVGDKWTVNTKEGEMKIVKNYELKDVTSGIATIITTNTKNGTMTKEARGMTMEMTIDSKGNGTILVDIKTGIVKKITSTTEMEGTVEVMGSSNPISNKSSSVTIVE